MRGAAKAPFRVRLSTPLFAALALAVLFGCTRGKDARPTPPDAGPRPVSIFVSSDLRGYLGPCGCSENMRGGIARAAYQVSQARKSGDVLFFDAGDALFTQVKIPDVAVPQERRKAQAIADAFKQMGLSARGTGERDDALGADFRTSLQLPEIPRDGFKTFTVGGHPVPAAFADSEEGMLRAAKAARESGALLVMGLLHGTFESARKLADNPALEADLLVPSHAENENAGEESTLLRTRVPVAQVQSKGRSLLRLDATFGGDKARFEWVASEADRERELASLDKRIEMLRSEVNAPGLKPELLELKRKKLEEVIARREERAAAPAPVVSGKNALAARFVPLESNFPSEPSVEKLVKAYDVDVAKLNLAWAKEHGQDCPKPKKGEAAYVGNTACKECHDESFAVWDGSKHAHAYKTLEEKARQYDLECVRCHVVGMNQPGGVCRVDKVEGRAEVGCESCHGPGSIHSEDPSDTNIRLGNTRETCVGCHDKENSPHFDFESYISQILGPGHGRKKR